VKGDHVLRALLGTMESLAAIPSGVGINCTSPIDIGGPSAAPTKALRSRFESGEIREVKRPTFVLCPNGGWTYDTLTRRWGDGKLETERWANDIHNIAKEGGDQQSAVREKEYGEV